MLGISYPTDSAWGQSLLFPGVIHLIARRRHAGENPNRGFRIQAPRCPVGAIAVVLPEAANVAIVPEAAVGHR